MGINWFIDLPNGVLNIEVNIQMILNRVTCLLINLTQHVQNPGINTDPSTGIKRPPQKCTSHIHRKGFSHSAGKKLLRPHDIKILINCNFVYQMKSINWQKVMKVSDETKTILLTDKNKF